MSTVGEREKSTQERVIKFFEDALGYSYLGNWTGSAEDNSNIIPEFLTNWLRNQKRRPQYHQQDNTSTATGSSIRW